MRCLLIVFSLFLTNPAECQLNTFEDELKELQLSIDQAPSQYHKFVAASHLCFFAIENRLVNDVPKAFAQLTKCVDKTDLTQHIIYLGIQGEVQKLNEELAQAEISFQQALDLADALNNDLLFYEIYCRLGQTYGAQSKLYLSNSIFFECLPYFEGKGDLETVSILYNDIGYNYSLYGEHEKAIHYLEKCRVVGLEMNDLNAISSADINAGYCYEEVGDFEKALEKYHESLVIHKEMGIQTYVAYSYVLLGTTHIKLGDLDSGRYYLDLTKEFLDPSDDYGASFLHYGNSLYYEAKGDFKRSEEEALRSVSAATNCLMIDNVTKALDHLRGVYVRENKFKQAYETFEQFVTLRDSLKNPLNSSEIAGLEYKYEYQNKQIADSLQFAEENRINAIRHRETLKRYWSYGIGVMVILVILVVLLYSILKSARQRKKINLELTDKNLEINAQKEKIEKAHRELASKNDEILDSISYAKRIQNAILPPLKVVKEYLSDSFILYKPKDIVAGDFYWLEQKDGHVLFAVADCTGHGVPGAMVSVICNNGLNRAVREYGITDPGAILDMTRRIVTQEFEKSEEEVNDGMDIALCSLCTSSNDPLKKTYTLKYAGANNPLWIVREGGTEIEEIRADKQPIGKFFHNNPYTTHQIDVSKGDTIYIFTDGYADQFGGREGKKFKSANFKKLICSIQAEPFLKHQQLLDDAFEQWKGQLEQLDDVCVIGVRL